GDDLADAFRVGAAYLTESVQWALGTRQAPPDAGPAAVTAGIRLDEELRGFLAEQGAKHLSKADLWMLVMGTMPLRLTAYSLAASYERTAVLVGRPMAHEVLLPVSVPTFTGLNTMSPVADPNPADVSAL